MTAILCISSALLACTPSHPARGAHAHTVTYHDRGGRAVIVLEPVGDVAAWTCIHDREGAWTDNTGNGYHGGLQFDASFEAAYGADMLRKYGGDAETWSPRDQMVVAERGRVSGRGYYPWPNTARACGLI